MLTKVKVKNFKCFKEESLDLSSLTFLSGLNGMGKSTIIQSLLLLRQSYLQNMLKNGLMLNGDLVRIGTCYDALYQGANEEKVSFNIETSEKINAFWEWGYDTESEVLPKLLYDCNEKIYSNLNLFSEKFHYLSAERLGPRTTFKASSYKVSKKNNMGTRGEFTAHYLSKHRKDNVIKELMHPETSRSDLENQVEVWMKTISPGIKINIEEYITMDLVNLNYQFISSGEIKSNKFRSTNVGFGITNVLPVIVALLSAEKEAIVIIENPEAHLHPKGQFEIGRLASLASAAGVQVIIETHSDHILNGIRVAVKENNINKEKISLNFFQRSKDNFMNHEIASPRIDEEGRLDFWPEGFFDEWDKSLSKLL